MSSSQRIEGLERRTFGFRFFGRGAGPDTFEGTRIVARRRWHSISARTAAWGQAFSVNDGLTWERTEQ